MNTETDCDFSEIIFSFPSFYQNLLSSYPQSRSAWEICDVCPPPPLSSSLQKHPLRPRLYLFSCLSWRLSPPPSLLSPFSPFPSLSSLSGVSHFSPICPAREMLEGCPDLL